MLTLPIAPRSSGSPVSANDISLGRGSQAMCINPLALKKSLEESDAQYLHLSSSACLRGMNDPKLPFELKGCLLPAGKLHEHNLCPESGEGGGNNESLKWHAISVCNTINVDDSLHTLNMYSGTDGFIKNGDFPVLFAVHNTGKIASRLEGNTDPVIDPPGKMDVEEFAIRGIIEADSIRAIYVRADNKNDAWRMLDGLPELQQKLNTSVCGA